MIAERGLLAASYNALLTNTATPFQTGTPTIGGFLRTLRSKSLKLDHEELARYDPEGDTSEADWDMWRHGGVFLEGALDTDFILGVFQAAAAHPQDAEEGPNCNDGTDRAKGCLADNHSQTLLLHSGPPSFDEAILTAVEEFGLKGHQIVSFPRSTKPLPNLEV